jgi:hypothetical protein
VNACAFAFVNDLLFVFSCFLLGAAVGDPAPMAPMAPIGTNGTNGTKWHSADSSMAMDGVEITAQPCPCPYGARLS